MKRLCAILTALLAVSACIRDRLPDGSGLEPGDRLPDFSIVMNDGSVLRTEDLAGKISVIVLFHTGCPDCRAELPDIQRIYDEYSPEVSVFCISREEEAADVEAYWAANGLSVPYSAQKDRNVYGLFASTGVPRTYVSDPDLTVRTVYGDSPTATYMQLSADIREISDSFHPDR